MRSIPKIGLQSFHRGRFIRKTRSRGRSKSRGRGRSRSRGRSRTLKGGK